jgi:AcrR family transcriptional regulator
MMNTKDPNVQDLDEMWGDPRVERSTGAVMSALRELLPEIPYRDLTVQQILDHAGVSRGTFYKHYRSKDDAFRASLAGMVAMFQRHPARGDRVFPVRELIDHVASASALRGSLAGTERFERIWDDLRDELAFHLTGELAPADGSSPHAPVLAARVLGGAMVELVRWSAVTESSIPPTTLDTRFQRMAATTIAAFGCVRVGHRARVMSKGS